MADTKTVAAASADAPVLSVRDINVTFRSPRGSVRAVNGVTWDLRPGEVLGVVGESGSGKSAMALSILGLQPKPPRCNVSGSAVYAGTELLGAPERTLREVRGNGVSMIFQDPMSSLNPLHTVGRQIAEAIATHHPEMSPQKRWDRAVQLLTDVGIPDPASRAGQYPHEYSGGMRQRAMIAMAMSNDPRVLIADEPTTALDVTIQAQVVQLLRRIRDETGTAIVLITHDLGLVAEIADRVVVMYGGRVVEEGPVHRIFRQPAHPYTVGLMRSMPKLEQAPAELPSIPGQPPDPAQLPTGCAFHPRCPLARDREPCLNVVPPLEPLADGGASACHFRDELSAAAASLFESETPGPVHVRAGETLDDAPAILEAERVVKHFTRSTGLIRRRREITQAVSEVDLTLHAGKTLALVGESGSGKSTLARLLLGLLSPTDGEIRLRGEGLRNLSSRELRSRRRHIQIVFQDPYASLNPVRLVGEIIADPLLVHRYEGDIDARVEELLELVGLDPSVRDRYPHAFSGGQRQRVCIARALALDPDILVLDEPVSALDVSVQAQVLNLLNRLQERLGVAYLLISHDLAVVRQFADEVAVMYMGRIVERGPASDIYDAPAHHYTRALLDAVPIPDPRGREDRLKNILGGDVPSPNNPPSGCRFRTRCPRAEGICADETPVLSGPAGARQVACHFPLTGDPARTGVSVAADG